MSRWVVGALVVVVALVAASCRDHSAAPTTTATTTGPLGVVIAQCRLVEDSVTLLNQANSARNLHGWTIHDEGRENEYQFFNYFIDHAKTTVILSGADAAQEANTRGEDIWPGGTNVWDDAGDTAYLLNPAGEIVDQRECT